MKVLVACEFSATVRSAFIRAGHDATSCDLLPCASSNGKHYQGDVFDILNDEWDLMIAHPPCTYLTNAGVSWLHQNPARWEAMRAGAEFFRRLLESDIPMKAIENPVMHRYAVAIVGRKADQYIQPWQFGHGETKRIGLWLDGLPKLVSTNIVSGREPRSHFESPGSERWKARSRFFTGVAKAMADQWGSL